jgi:dihydrofolate reductase
MKISVYVATSLDGFIAKQNGELDWLPASSGQEDYGYADFMAEIDALVMGRATFEKVLTFAAWPYGEKPVFVLSNRPLKLPPSLVGRVRVMPGSPQEIIQAIADWPLPDGRRIEHIYLDGGRTIQGFLREGLVDQLILTRAPVLLGGGLPLFGPLQGEVRLRHVETRAYPDGLVQSRYAVEK